MNLDLKAVKKCQELIAIRDEFRSAKQPECNLDNSPGQHCAGCDWSAKYDTLMKDIKLQESIILMSIGCR